jgi:hypothetical protein
MSVQELSAVIEIWGDFALWTNPEARLSGSVTPFDTVASGYFGAIYSNAGFYWQVQRNEILNHTITAQRNG